MPKTLDSLLDDIKLWIALNIECSPPLYMTTMATTIVLNIECSPGTTILDCYLWVSGFKYMIFLEYLRLRR